MQGTTRLRRIAEGPDDEISGAELAESISAAPPPAQAPMGDRQRQIISAALQMALRTLSQKTVVALASLFSLLLAGSAFWIFLTVLGEPTVLQLVGAGMYAVFVLSLHLVRRR